MAVVSSWFAVTALAALALAGVEIAALGGGVGLALTVASLFAALALTVGLALWLPAALLARRRAAQPVGARAAALVRAAPALVPLAYLGRHLFDGARASTLPGASLAPVLVPLLGYLAIAFAVWLGGRLLARSRRPVARIALALPLAGLFVASEWLDRNWFPGGYPDVHLFLALVSLTSLAVALRIVLSPAPSGRGTSAFAVVVWAVATALVVVGFGLSLRFGLGDHDDRRRVATRGSHARQLVRVVRAAIDRDGDGFSPVLGGGDCDDGEARVNPGAAEVAGDGRDQDCDGADLAAAPVAVVSADEQWARWRSDPVRAALVARGRRANVLFISVDALRADAIGADTPRIAALLASSAQFAHAFAPAAGTDLSLASVATGLANPFSTVNATLFEVLAASGRHGRAVLPREVLRYAGKNLLGRGLSLDVIANDREERDVSHTTSAVETTDHALADLDQLSADGQPFTLWVHFFDVHEHRQIDRDDPALLEVAGARDLTSRAGKYQALAALVDREVGRLLDGLAERGLDDRTVIVFFGDHGESLGEDPRLPDNHGRFLYEALVRVPLAVRAPGAGVGPRSTACSLLDIAPTILDLLDLPSPPGLFGRSLAPLLAGDDAPLFADARPLPLHESDQFGVVRWPLKLLVRPADNLVELYDLVADPGEHDDLAERRPTDVAALKADYAAFPSVVLDRTRRGRALREAQGQAPSPPR